MTWGLGKREKEGPSSEAPDHLGDAEDVDGPEEFVGEDREAHFGSHISQSLSQEVPLVHAPLDRSEGMFHNPFPALRPLAGTLSHALKALP